MTPKIRNKNVPTQQHTHGEPALHGTIQCPGLTNRHNRLKELADGISKALVARQFKRDIPFLWCVVAGGTGTGKSSIFNALCGRHLSVAGVQRPKTRGAVAYAHASFPEISGSPSILPPIEKIQEDTPGYTPTTGIPNRIVMLTHQRRNLQRMVLVDTPDLDSLDHTGKNHVEDMALQADFIIFVASQEKYADQVPTDFLHKVTRGGTPCFFVLNKAAPETSLEEIKATLERHGIPIPPSRIAIIPQGGMAGRKAQTHLEGFIKTVFEECSRKNEETLRKCSVRRLGERIAQSAGEAVEILEEEIKESRIWLEKLVSLHARSCEAFLRSEEARLTDERTRHLRVEIRKLFSRYDVLAGPRRLIQSVLVFPLRLIGLGAAKPGRDRKKELETMRGRLDLAPLFAALESFNRSVLESLSPVDPSAPVYTRLRETPVLNESEVYKIVAEAQKELETWLASTFEDLEQKLPKSKKWGIYTTAVMWGVLIVSLEAALGGGFTVVDAAVGSALAPFATKGAVELFALREIQKIAKELSRRLKKGLLSVLDEQKSRYEDFFVSLMPQVETVERMKRLTRETPEPGDDTPVCENKSRGFH